ncbi:hypothetical protein [Sphingomonas sp. Leaf37]|uniref:hypothetical protein n=1 Tax=Sphingomonas sp. Leaf37 TaxID=2876552 RepID=UPI001E4BDE14|nr:hypothetical protein [Sphingomonas sp. Leaf37]
MADGIGSGDRVLYQGIGQRRGKQADVLTARRDFASVRFDDGLAVLCRSVDLLCVPRRPPAMF